MPRRVISADFLVQISVTLLTHKWVPCTRSLCNSLRSCNWKRIGKICLRLRHLGWSGLLDLPYLGQKRMWRDSLWLLWKVLRSLMSDFGLSDGSRYLLGAASCRCRCVYLSVIGLVWSMRICFGMLKQSAFGLSMTERHVALRLVFGRLRHLSRLDTHSFEQNLRLRAKLMLMVWRR